MRRRREIVLLVILIGVAFGLRLWHLHALRADVLFEHPALDEARYAREAQRLTSGAMFEPRPFWQPPGTIYALAAALYVARLLHVDGFLCMHLAGVLAGTSSCLLTYTIARRVTGPRAALLAAAIMAVHGAAIFGSGELLPAVWASLFDLLALHFAFAARRSSGRAALSGLCFGASALFTPVVLPFVLLFGAYLALRARRRTVVAFALAVALPIAPVTLRNWQRGHELVFISTNGGLNFYLGNNAHAAETLEIRPGPRWTELTELPWRSSRVSGPAASSAWFFRRGLAYWAEHPSAAAAYYARKIWLFFHAAEIPRDTDPYLLREGSPALRASLQASRPFLLNGLLIPLALVGLAARFRDRKALWLIVFVAMQAGFVSLFFVSARHRMPVLPLLAVFAVLGAVALRRAPLRWGVVLLGLSIGCALPAREVTRRFSAEPSLYRGLARRERGEERLAIEEFERGTRADPKDPRPWVELATSFTRSGRSADAARAWEDAARADPRDARPLREAASLHVTLGDRASAIRVLRANLTSAAPHEHDKTQLAKLHLLEGDERAAARYLADAARENRSFARAEARALARAHRATIVAPQFWAQVDALE